MIKNITRVRGIAVREGISRNGIKYTKEELQKFSLGDRPILKDHNATVDNTVGRVETSQTSASGDVSYEGWVKDDGNGLLEKIKDGRIKEVSIGAIVRLVKEKDEDEHLLATNMDGLELSLTPTPGNRGTSITQALESIQKHKLNDKIRVLAISESVNDIQHFKHIKEEIKMAEEEKPVEEAPVEEEPKEEAPVEEAPAEEAPKEEAPAEEKPAEEPKTESIKLNVDNSGLKESVQLLEKAFALKEKMKDKPVVKEQVTKGKVAEKKSEEVSEEVKDYVVEDCSFGEGASIYKMPKSDGSY